MKNTFILLTILTIFTFSLNGCGGGGGSASETEVMTDMPSPSTPRKTPNSIEVNPLLQLGLKIGDDFCLRMKAYTNTTKSDFSDSVCVEINNNEALLISWDNASNSVIGYEIYYGNKENNTSNFLQDIMVL